MKIDVVSNDGKTISQHFGGAMNYIVCDVENFVKGSEIRSKAAQGWGVFEAIKKERIKQCTLVGSTAPRKDSTKGRRS